MRMSDCMFVLNTVGQYGEGRCFEDRIVLMKRSSEDNNLENF